MKLPLIHQPTSARQTDDGTADEYVSTWQMDDSSSDDVNESREETSDDEDEDN